MLLGQDHAARSLSGLLVVLLLPPLLLLLLAEDPLLAALLLGQGALLLGTSNRPR